MKKLNIKKIIETNPLIREKSFQIEQKLIEERKKVSSKKAAYNIIPPFTTERRIRAYRVDDDLIA